MERTPLQLIPAADPPIEPPTQPPTAAPPPPPPSRPTLRGLVRDYPRTVGAIVLLVVALALLDWWAIDHLRRYRAEIGRLRAGMTNVERQRADALVAGNQNHLRLTIEMLRRQARGDQTPHLAISVDSGLMYFAREGATLREMSVETGPERTVGTPPDTVRMAVPRGSRTVERVLGPDDSWEVPAWVYSDRGLPVPSDRVLKGALGPSAIVLAGGAVLYAMPSVGPLNDSSYVLPGSVRASASDLRAIAPNVTPGMTVYIY